ncbi:hypothetical protein D3C72_2234540 [compost metagenome]
MRVRVACIELVDLIDNILQSGVLGPGHQHVPPLRRMLVEGLGEDGELFDQSSNKGGQNEPGRAYIERQR